VGARLAGSGGATKRPNYCTRGIEDMLLAAAGTRECRPAGRVPHAALRIDWSPRTISPAALVPLRCCLRGSAHYYYHYNDGLYCSTVRI